MKRNKPSPKKDVSKNPTVLMEGNYQLAKISDIQKFSRQQLMSFAVKFCKFYEIRYDFKGQINVERDELLHFCENLIKTVESASTAGGSCITKKLKMSSSNAKLKMFDKTKSTFAGMLIIPIPTLERRTRDCRIFTLRRRTTTSRWSPFPT